MTAEPGDVLRRELPGLLEFLRRAVPALAVRPVLGGILTAAIDVGVGTFLDYRAHVRAHPIVPYAVGHRPTRRELASYIRRRTELAHLEYDLRAAESAGGAEAERLWQVLRIQVGTAQAELTAPLAGHRGAVARLDGFLARLLRAGTVDLPSKEKRAILDYVRERLEESHKTDESARRAARSLAGRRPSERR